MTANLAWYLIENASVEPNESFLIYTSSRPAMRTIQKPHK